MGVGGGIFAPKHCVSCIKICLKNLFTVFHQRVMKKKMMILYIVPNAHLRDNSVHSPLYIDLGHSRVRPFSLQMYQENILLYPQTVFEGYIVFMHFGGCGGILFSRPL